MVISGGEVQEQVRRRQKNHSLWNRKIQIYTDGSKYPILANCLVAVSSLLSFLFLFGLDFDSSYRIPVLSTSTVAQAPSGIS